MEDTHSTKNAYTLPYWYPKRYDVLTLSMSSEEKKVALDSRTETNIATLTPKAQEQARVFMGVVLSAGISAKIIDGNRTYAEQNALFRKGRDSNGNVVDPSKVVTNARGGQSNHNFGIAWDIGVFSGNTYLGNSPLYDTIGKIGRDLGLEWGGDWHSFTDKPHYQCRTGKTIQQVRALFESGQPIPILDLLISPKVEVLLDGAAISIPALFKQNHVWVGVRAFTEKFGGEILSVGATQITVLRDNTAPHSPTKECPSFIYENTGYVMFADINSLYHLPYQFNSTPLRLALESI